MLQIPASGAGEYFSHPDDWWNVTSLLSKARTARREAYAPYSEYAVGAALQTTDGTVYTGCNVENANFSNSLHAEEVALGTAISDGQTEFERIAVSSSEVDGVTPCGMCRQTLVEFCSPAFEIVCDGPSGPTTYTLGELLPAPITRGHLQEE